MKLNVLSVQQFVAEMAQAQPNKKWSQAKALRLIKKGRIVAMKVGWFWVIPVSEVNRLKEDASA